jgi:hypothetical protein
LKNRINSCLGRRTRRSLQLNTKQVELLRILFSIGEQPSALNPVLFALILRSPVAIPVAKKSPSVTGGNEYHRAAFEGCSTR